MYLDLSPFDLIRKMGWSGSGSKFKKNEKELSTNNLLNRFNLVIIIIIRINNFFYYRLVDGFQQLILFKNELF